MDHLKRCEATYGKMSMKIHFKKYMKAPEEATRPVLGEKAREEREYAHRNKLKKGLNVQGEPMVRDKHDDEANEVVESESLLKPLNYEYAGVDEDDEQVRDLRH